MVKFFLRNTDQIGLIVIIIIIDIKSYEMTTLIIVFFIHCCSPASCDYIRAPDKRGKGYFSINCLKISIEN